MAISAAHLRVDIDADTSGMDKGMGKADSKIGGLAGTVGKFALAAGAAGGAAAVAFGVKAVMGASDLNETVSKIGVVFGEQQGIVTGYADQMARDFGAPKQEILDAAASIGLIGKASGLSQADAANMSTELAQMAVDASSFYNVPLPEALQAIQSGLVGEAEPMRRFGVLLNEAAVQEEAVALGLATMGQELTEGMKAQARASLITKGMSDASGDLARTQDSLANRIKEAKGRAMNFATDVGSRLLPIVLQAFDLFERWGPVIRDVVAGAFQRLGEVVSPIIGWFQGLMAGGEGVSGSMSAMAPVLETVKAVWDTFSAKVQQIAGYFGEFVVFIQTQLGAFQEATKHILNVVRGIWAAVGDEIWSIVKRVWSAIAETIRAVMNIVKGIIQTVLALINGDWGKAWDGIKMILDGVWDAIAGIVRLGTGVIKDLVEAALSLIRVVWNKAWEEVSGFVGKTWETIKTKVSGGIGAVVGFISGLPGKAYSAAIGLRDKLVEVARAAWEAFDSAVDTAVAGVLEFVGGIPGKIVSAIGNMGSLLKDAGKQVIQGLLDGIENMIGKVKSKLQSVTSLIPDWKGPARVDRTLLYGSGQLVMQGFVNGLEDKVPTVKRTLQGITDDVAGMAMGSDLGRLAFGDLARPAVGAVAPPASRAGILGGPGRTPAGGVHVGSVSISIGEGVNGYTHTDVERMLNEALRDLALHVTMGVRR